MSKKFRIIAGLAAIWLGLMMFMGTARRGMMARAHYAHAQSAQFESRREARQANSAFDGTNSAEADSTDAQQHSHRHASRHHHRGGLGLIGGLLRLVALGFIIKLVLGALRRRRGSHEQHNMRAEAPDDLAQEIRVGDEIDRDQNTASDSTSASDDLTVDDLLHAMKKLGIKKLEL